MKPNRAVRDKHGHFRGSVPATATPHAAPAATTNVLPFSRTITVGDALASLSPQATATPVAAPPDVRVPTHSPPAPEGFISPPPPAPLPTKTSNQKFARIAGRAATGVAITIMASQIRRGGHEPRELDDDDQEAASEATAECIARGIGDGDVPWWAPVFTSWGQLWLSMRLGAKPIAKPLAPTPAPLEETTTTDEPTAAVTDTESPAPPLPPPAFSRLSPPPLRAVNPPTPLRLR